MTGAPHIYIETNTTKHKQNSIPSTLAHIALIYGLPLKIIKLVIFKCAARRPSNSIVSSVCVFVFIWAGIILMNLFHKQCAFEIPQSGHIAFKVDVFISVPVRFDSLWVSPQCVFIRYAHCWMSALLALCIIIFILSLTCHANLPAKLGGVYSYTRTSNTFGNK